MTTPVYVISAVLVFVFSGLLAMADLGAVFLFVTLLYSQGVPLAEAMQAALLLNVISLLFATVNYWRNGLINRHMGVPVLITVPLDARLTLYSNARTADRDRRSVTSTQLLS